MPQYRINQSRPQICEADVTAVSKIFDHAGFRQFIRRDTITGSREDTWIIILEERSWRHYLQVKHITPDNNDAIFAIYSRPKRENSDSADDLGDAALDLRLEDFAPRLTITLKRFRSANTFNGMCELLRPKE